VSPSSTNPESSPPEPNSPCTDRPNIDALLPAVYKELRAIAEQRLRTLSPGASLQPTELLHEAYARLAADGDRSRWENHQHFIAAAALAMRSVLVDHARAKAALKRGGAQRRRVPLEDIPIALDRPAEEVLAVDKALTELEKVDPRSAQVVVLRYYLGLTDPEISQALGITDRTVRRDWAFAKLWLQRALSADQDKPHAPRKDGE
jgi:RNA polymerase sigma factor (TIGR02999 family)